MPKQSPRKNSNWFKIETIAQMLSEETGESTDALEQDLEKWNSDFIRQKESTITETSDDDGETTRLFYGSLFRQIQRKVLEAYCSDRGYKKPSLWLSSSVGRSNLSGPIVVEARLAGQPGPEARPVQAVDGSSFDSPSATLLKRSYPEEETKAAAEVSNVEAARQKAGAEAKAERQKLIRAAETASAEAVALRKQLETARQQIASPNAAAERCSVSESKSAGPATKQSNPMGVSTRRTEITEAQAQHNAGKRVAVVHEDGRVLRTDDIDFGNLDREPLDHWYLNQARENAIADKLVAKSEAMQISCRFVDDLGEEKASEHPAVQASFLPRKGADPAATKRHDDTDQSRSEVPNLEQRRTAQASFLPRKGADQAETKPVARIAKKVAWVAAITVAIGAIIAIFIKLFLLSAGIPRDIS